MSPSWVIVAVLCVLLSSLLYAGLANGNPRPDQGGSVLLGRGSIGETFQWRVLAYGSRGQHGGRRPCIEAQSSAADGGRDGSSFTLCGSLRELPIILAKSSGSGKAERTVFAIVYRPEVVSVRLWLGGHPSRLIHLHPLAAGKAQRTHMRKFNYEVLAVAHHFCLSRIVAYNGKGKVLDPGRRIPCDR